MSYPLTTTLNRIWACNPCDEGKERALRGAMIVPLLHSLNQKMQPIVAAHLELERRRTTKTIQAIEEIREDPDDCKDYEDNYRAGWTDACNAILDHLNAESISTRQEH